MLQTQSKNSRLLAWLNEQKRPQRLREVIEKEKHLEFIRHAQEEGYLLTPSSDFLLDQFSPDGGGSKRLRDIVQVQLFNMRLKDVGDVGLCHNLQYCSLPGNYITRFDGLATCTRLIRLDLHDNQISRLPGSKFWRNFPDLKILYLHNNSIGRLSFLQNLGATPNLQILTLFDTPISLKKSYRHHVVNSIFTLRALDFHVISDEEIIEDAKFGSHFSAMHRAFCYHPLLNIEKERDIETERETVPRILREVSSIQAKHSPVFIIQRYIRGFLGRCKAKRIVASRVWAAVCIQRHWRRYKGREYTPSPRKTPKSSEGTLDERGPSTTTVQSSPYPSNRDGTPDTTIQSKMDYDAYLENRRPGSTSPERNVELQLSNPAVTKVIHQVSRSTPSPTSQHRASIMVNLTTLEGAAQYLPIDELYSTANIQASQRRIPDSTSFIQPEDIERDQEKLRNEINRGIRTRRTRTTVGELLGPLREEDLQREVEVFSDEEKDPVSFRISGLKSVFHRGDPTQELLIERRETGRDIRATHRDIIDTIPQPKPIVKRRKPPNGTQRLYTKIHGTLGMASLKAVEQAYKDRGKAEDTAHQADYVNSLRERRDLAKERRKSYLEDQRLVALQKRDDDACEVAEALRRRATLKEQGLERAKELRKERDHGVKASNQERMFAADFGGQHTSISKALLKHDRQLIRGELLRTNNRIVETERDYQRSQAELVERYLEHRKLMRQAQAAVERAALDSRVVQGANDRLIQAQNRVVHRKQGRKKVQSFYPLPKTATDPVLPPVIQEGRPDRFETMISMYEGRIGNHPPVF